MIFQIIDINVLTSISEGFPYVILEGARFEKVFVGTRVGGLADLVDSGQWLLSRTQGLEDPGRLPYRAHFGQK